MKRDFRVAHLSDRQRILCVFAEKLTLRTQSMQPDDLETLRRAGLSDEEVLDAVQVVSYFNYINRIAEALGVDPEPEMEAEWRRLQEQSGGGPQR
ncbi:MAG: peroxidase [Acidobacteria bacterium]|nr:peroxidase [Acidobacteriota bacterium]